MGPRWWRFALGSGCLLLLAALAGACSSNGSAPTSPPGVMASYEGDWSGMTSQGMRISFTVSGQKVTSINVGYNFSGCNGTNSFPNLNLAIGYPPNRTTPYPGPGFGFGSGAPEGPDYTQVSGTFSSSTAATGSMIFGGYSGCGNSLGIWSANKK
jgi:hypothetical protein